MARQPKDLEYCAEFAKPGEGPDNAELWMKCARTLLGCDPRLICKELNQPQEKTSQTKVRDRAS